MRWGYEKEGNNRFDKEQLEWLDHALGSNEADITLIGSSIQVIPDIYYASSEAFNYKNKRLLFDLLDKHRKSGVLVLSGDVHFTQLYSTKCLAHFGGYKLYELTSSGLSHHQNHFQLGGFYELSLLSHPFWLESPVHLDLNFGLVDINQTHVVLRSINLERHVLIEKVVEWGKELVYDQGKRWKNGRMCEVSHREHKTIMHVNNMVEHTIVKKNPMVFIMYY